MPPEQAEILKDVSSPESSILLTPTSSCSEANSHCPSDNETTVKDSETVIKQFKIPDEKTLKELVIQISGTNDLETVITLKLKVLAREMSLQHLSFHTPNLRELILDGSVVTSLRELGCGLKNLKVLRVNRCGLESLDGIGGLENVEEFYGTDNRISDASPFITLDFIKVVDLRRNKLKCLQTLGFLKMCDNLEEMELDGNDEITSIPMYRNKIRKLLPNLKKLDQIPLEECLAFENELEELKSEEINVRAADKQISESEDEEDKERETDDENEEKYYLFNDIESAISHYVHSVIEKDQKGERIRELETKIDVIEEESTENEGACSAPVKTSSTTRKILLPPIKRNSRNLPVHNRPSSAQNYSVKFPPKLLSTKTLKNIMRPSSSKYPEKPNALLPDISENETIQAWNEDSDLSE